MARLILLNGPPGVGKSTVARRYAEGAPLMLLVDIDGIRRSLGGWEAHDETKGIARDLAVALVDAHLRAGHDVIVPQHLGRTSFIERLEQVAGDAGATFAEIVLWDDEDAVADRFRTRRMELRGSDEAHPEQEVADGDVAEAIADATALLRAVVAERPHTVTITAGPDLNGTVARLREVLDVLD